MKGNEDIDLHEEYDGNEDVEGEDDDGGDDEEEDDDDDWNGAGMKCSHIYKFRLPKSPNQPLCVCVCVRARARGV